jgi:hypothetical protein
MYNQIADISVEVAMTLLLKALFDEITESFRFLEQDQSRLMKIFLKHLPAAIRKNLMPAA